MMKQIQSMIQMKMMKIMNIVQIEENINDMLGHMIMVVYNELFQLVLEKND